MPESIRLLLPLPGLPRQPSQQGKINFFLFTDQMVLLYIEIMLLRCQQIIYIFIIIAGTE